MNRLTIPGKRPSTLSIKLIKLCRQLCKLICESDLVRGKAFARGAPVRRSLGQTGTRILAEAKEIVARKGVDALRLATISSRLEISTPAIYAHFPGGRSEIVDRIALDGVDSMIAFFPRGPGTALQDLDTGISSLVQFYAANPAFLRIMLLDFSSPIGHSGIYREIGPPGPFADGAFRAMYGRLNDILRSLEASGIARAVSADVLLNLILGATALNLIYPPLMQGGTRRVSATVTTSIVRDMVNRYIELAPSAFTNTP